MGQWVITVAGIAIVSVLCDVILPDGQTRKYIKTVIGIVVTVVMLQPLIDFSGGVFKSDYNTSYGEYQVQQTYLDMVEDKQLNTRLSCARSKLSAYGIEVQSAALRKADKTVSMQVSAKYSQASESKIKEIIREYFTDYTVSIGWKG